jgi:hypothetical protein
MKVFIGLRFYPMIILLYAAGMGAVANDRYMTLRRLLENCRYYAHGTERMSLPTEIWHWKAESSDIWNKHILGKNFITPLSDHLHEILREPLKPLCHQQSRYNDVFDRFEYFSALHEFQQTKWGPVGSFLWRGRRGGTSIIQVIVDEFSSGGVEWPPIATGLLKNGRAGVEKTMAGFAEHLERVRNQYHVW